METNNDERRVTGKLNAAVEELRGMGLLVVSPIIFTEELLVDYTEEDPAEVRKAIEELNSQGLEAFHEMTYLNQEVVDGVRDTIRKNAEGAAAGVRPTAS